MRASLSSGGSTSASDADTAAKVIQILKEKIQNPPKRCSSECRKLLKKFQQIIQEMTIDFPGGMHCETLLATLGKFFELSHEGDDNANLLSTCKVLFLHILYCLPDLIIYHKKLLQSGMISVSKLCCPVCWELLAILGKENPLLLRGRHSTIYAVELPKWLPSEIVDEMNERFQIYLRREIKIMLDGAKQKADFQVRHRHTTHESESNISVASTNFAIDLKNYEY